MLKSEKGITLMVLVLTVIIMMILISAGITYGARSVSEIGLQNFSYELQQIQGRVDVMHERMNAEGDETYTKINKSEIGDNITSNSEAVAVLAEVIPTANYSGSPDSSLYADTNNNTTIYRYFSRDKLSKELDISNPKFDVIINFKTREVISVKPYNYDGENHYWLRDI